MSKTVSLVLPDALKSKIEQSKEQYQTLSEAIRSLIADGLLYRQHLSAINQLKQRERLLKLAKAQPQGESAMMRELMATEIKK